MPQHHNIRGLYTEWNFTSFALRKKSPTCHVLYAEDMACSYYKWIIVPSKYTWQEQLPFFSPHSDRGHRMPHEGKSRWPSVLTNTDILWSPGTRRGDKELWKNKSDLGFIHTSHQDEEEMELKKIHDMYLHNDSRRWGLKSTQETGLENRILWCHTDRDLCSGLRWKGTPSPREWADGGLGWWAGSFRRTNSIYAPQKIKLFSKGCLSYSQVTVAVALCALHSRLCVPMEVTRSLFSFPDLILPLRWRLPMLECLAHRQTTSYTDWFPFLPQTLLFFVFPLLKKQYTKLSRGTWYRLNSP